MQSDTVSTKQQTIQALKDLLGSERVETNDRKTEYYRSGIRSGRGEALAVVFPDTLLEYWQLLEVCVAANCIIIMQAAKTGLTEGSAPAESGYDRDVVIINTLKMNDISLLNDGKQVLSFPGATLHALEKKLKDIGRTPHSVIGSSTLGATIVGGVANNSGGALVKRGPAYTEMALFARVTEEGKLELVNHLGVDLGESPEEIFTNLQQHKYESQVADREGKIASDREYVDRVRNIDAETPARFNADKRRLYEASGCAGKLAVFAVRLDTFPVSKQEQTFYIGTNDATVLTQLRREILADFNNVPEVGEYIHRDMFAMGEKYGKDNFLTIQFLGTDILPKMFRMKGSVDAALNKISFLPKFLSDRVLQLASRLWPQHLPKRMMDYHQRFEHHLIVKMSDEGITEAQDYFDKFFNDVSENKESRGEFFVCDDAETKKAYLQRFVAAGAAIRYETVNSHKVGELLALDIAIRRNDENWVEELPESISSQIEHSLYYGHFFCHVFHQDYILKKDADTKKVKSEMLALLDSRGAKYPAEHNVGHLYEADSDLQKFYIELDPTNTFNPGIGKMDKHKRNCNCC
ncbi:UNVERIFIED_CONTAM: hypothetical protein GTU68_043104 [Idotea baltica]|nr:hypothetical protein [Idotea baltica]